MDMKHLPQYELIKEEFIEEIQATAFTLRHKKTKANLFLLSNDDENKVFSIGFRTPPADSTGLPHILEHSVLCGSKKYPAKDPFIELAKGSLNTFLNAMTYPDKTVYPVASMNEQDFKNLMDVYLDAVFHPNIYENEKIFRQEGWHYEMGTPEDPIIINGVVYNEMKGAFSSPESVLDRYSKQVLFPDTCYGHESGGDPEVIPELSYQDFLDFHKKYYHPSNSYIYLYGNMDMEERLLWLDEEYLSHYEQMHIDSAIRLQKPFEKPIEKEIYYPVTSEESEQDRAYLSLSMVTGTDLEPDLYVAFEILDYALLSAPGAPLKQALLDAGIGNDIFGGYENGILQPIFSITAKEADPDKQQQFLEIIHEQLLRMAKEGIDRKALLAGMNYYEFRYREADYGAYPKGLMYGLQSLDSWLYGISDPSMHLKYAKTFENLKQDMEEGYFEKLIEDYLLNNQHKAFIKVLPKKGLTAKTEAALALKLQRMKEAMTSEEISQMVDNTHALRLFQEEPSSKEDLEKIPMLKREDISREVQPLYIKEKKESGTLVIHSDMFTSKISYLRLLFDLQTIADEDVEYVGLLKSILGLISTENYSFNDLFNEIYMNSGGLTTMVTTYPDMEKPGSFGLYFEFSVKVLYDKLDFAFSMVTEIIRNSIFRDEKRLLELLWELRSRTQRQLISSGHSAAMQRASAYESAMGTFNERVGGISYYKFIEYMTLHFAEEKEQLIAQLERLMKRIFTKENLIISYTGDEEGYSYLPKLLPGFKETLYEGSTDGQDKPQYPALEAANEGYKTSAGVQYVASCGNFLKAGYSFTGALRILKVLLSYDYLWTQVRIKGGAYGCMCGFARTGEGYFVSYRDPNLKETLAVYKQVPQFVRGFNADERTMTKYVIGAVSDMDTPLNPYAKGVRSLSAYLSHVKIETLQKEREQVLNASVEDIRALAGITEAIVSEHHICVIGAEEKIKAEHEVFGEVKNLFAKEENNQK